ncbi:MAG: autotransporter-associated beta strand repeat-containing protein [Akkermansiaceae bacterium]|jgi:autotransporter-associated beta strand protein|nr:autotransporter-associated beta strand repeat-containing protein [Akkermansiaceae bacterium]
MKTRHHSPSHQSFPLFSTLAATSSLLLALPSPAADYWWDSNGTTAGFGNTAGTWGTSSFWGTSSAGTSATANPTITSSDTVNFGTGAASNSNYNNSAVGIAAGGVTANSIVFGANQWRGINLGTAGNTLNLSGTTPTIQHLGVSAVHTFLSPISSSSGVTKSGVGTIVLSAAQTYSGGTTVSGGTLVFRNLASKTSDTHTFAAGTSLGLGVGGSGFFNSTDIDHAFAGTPTGNLSNVSWDSTTHVGIDTTAGNFSYTTDIAALPRGLHKLGSNTLTLGNNNAFTGPLILQGGQLNVATLANAGSNSSIGAFASSGADGLLLRGGVFNYTGTTVTTDRGFTATGIGNTIQVAAGQTLTFGNSIKNEVKNDVQPDSLRFTATGSGASVIIDDLTLVSGSSADFNIGTAGLNVTIRNLRVSGNVVIAQRESTGTGRILQVGNIIGTAASGWFSEMNITGEISGYTGTIFLGSNVTLSGLSSFNAPVTLQQGGIYTIHSIKNVSAGASSLGNPLTVANGTIGFGNLSNNPTLRYLGTGDTTNRVLNLRGSATLTIEQAGTGNLQFTANTTHGTGGAKTLRLTGSTTGTGEFSGIINDLNSSNPTSLVKAGTGTWTLSGANTYTGPTAVNDGVLALVGGSLTSAINVAATGKLGFTLGSPANSSSTVTFTTGSKVKITGTPSAPNEYLLMTASGGITGTPTLDTAATGYSIELRAGNTELWLDFNPNLQSHVINLGSGTTIAGGTFGTYSGPLTGLPLPSFPAGTLLRSIAINTTLTDTNADNFASELALLFDPTPANPGGDFSLVFESSLTNPPNPFSATHRLTHPISANGGVGTSIIDSRAESTWSGLTGPIDLSSTGIFLGNVFGNAPQGGTWSGTITLTYELPGGPYQTWASSRGLTGSNDGQGLDPDQDARDNLTEFAFDGNPLSGVNDGKIIGKLANIGSAQVLTLTLPVRSGAVFSADAGDRLSAAIDGVIYRIESDQNLGTFADSVTEVTGADATALQAGLPALSSGWVYRSFRAPGTAPATPRAFLRAKVTSAP